MSATPFAMPSRLSVSAFFSTGTIRPFPSASSTAKPRLMLRPRDDALAAELAVDPRVVLEGLDRGAGDEREVRDVHSVRALVLRLELLPERDDARHVDLDRARHVRRRVERAAHVLRDAASHRGHRLERLCRAPSRAGAEARAASAVAAPAAPASAPERGSSAARELRSAAAERAPAPGSGQARESGAGAEARWPLAPAPGRAPPRGGLQARAQAPRQAPALPTR